MWLCETSPISIFIALKIDDGWDNGDYRFVEVYNDKGQSIGFASLSVDDPESIDWSEGRFHDKYLYSP